MRKTTCHYYTNGLLRILLMVLSVAESSSQELVFRNITDDLNLPAHECYNVVQDKKGYIWISTENGLCRYNGADIKVFNKNSALQNNSVYFLKSMENGLLKVVTADNRIFTGNDTIFTERPYSREFSKATDPNIGLAYYSTEVNQEDIINTYRTSFKVDLQTNIITNTAINQKKPIPEVIVFYEDGKSYLLRQGVANLLQTTGKPETFIDITLVRSGRKKNVRLQFNIETEIDRRMKLVEAGGVLFLAIHNVIVKIQPSLEYTVHTYPSQILSLYTSNTTDLLVGLFQKGLYYHPDNRNLEQSVKALRDYSVSGALIDREGSLWCTTLEKGVFFCVNPYALTYTNIRELQKVTTFMKTIGGEVYTSTGYDNFFVLEEGKVDRKEIERLYGNDYTDLLYHNERWYLGGKGAAKVFDRSFRNGQFLRLNGAVGNQYHFEMLGGRIFSANLNALYEIKDGIAMLRQEMFWTRINCLLFYDENTIFIGSRDGLLHYDIKNNKIERIGNDNTPVSKLLKAKDGRIWVATKGNGMLVLEDNQSLKRIPLTGKGNEIFYDAVEDQMGTIWASSENGLISFSRKNNQLVTNSYGIAHGLISNNIEHLAVAGNYLYVSTVEGICSIRTDKGLVNNTLPPIYLNTIRVNGELQMRTGSMSFPYDMNSFKILFDVPVYKRNQEPLLLYKFENAKTWETSERNELEFNNLLPDDYILTVYSVNIYGLKSKDPIIIKFKIGKPFWQEWWFILLAILLFSGVLIFIVKKKIDNVRFKENEKTRINKLISESQLAALQAQMNPHFIFNAISSIQNYILKNDSAAAFEYLAKFGKLIRNVLNHSRRDTLTLEEEVETLQTYIELEQMRFRPGFEFRLLIDEGLDLHSVKIPSMLIQPYVENAIWHGLMNLEGSRSAILIITMSQYVDMLKIVVEDNGIGRRKSEANKKDILHLPVGMKLTQQRLEMLHKVTEYKKVSFTIEDLYHANGEAEGTRVTILIPITNSNTWNNE